MTEPGLTVEQRLAKLEAKGEARGTIFTILVFVAMFAYLLFSSGRLKFSPATTGGG